MNTLSETTWPSKRVEERVTALFDFGPALTYGDTLTGVTMTVSVVQGTDANPAAVLDGVPQEMGARVFQRLKDGLPGVSYEVKARATTLQANVYTLKRVLPVVPN